MEYVHTSGPHLCSCSFVLSEMSHEHGPDSHQSWSCVSLVLQFQCTCAWWHGRVQSEAQKNMVYEHRIRRNQELNHKILDNAKCVSHGSIVGIVTSYRLHGQGFKSWQGQEIFLFLKPVHIGSGAHPASYSIGTRCSGKAVGLFTASMCKTEWRYNSCSRCGQ